MSSSEHKAMAPAQVRVFVLTVSDTRTDQTDTAGHNNHNPAPPIQQIFELTRLHRLFEVAFAETGESDR